MSDDGLVANKEPPPPCYLACGLVCKGLPFLLAKTATTYFAICCKPKSEGGSGMDGRLPIPTPHGTDSQLQAIQAYYWIGDCLKNFHRRPAKSDIRPLVVLFHELNAMHGTCAIVPVWMTRDLRLHACSHFLLAKSPATRYEYE